MINRSKEWWIERVSKEGNEVIAAGTSTEEGVTTMSEMPAAEAIQMMNRCKHEIAMLRAQLAQTQPKADAYDNIATVLRLLPRPSVGMGEDVIWVLDKRIRELEAKPADPSPTPPSGA